MAGIVDIATTATRLVIQTGKAAYEYHAAKESQKDFERAAKRTEALNELNLRAAQAEAAEMERIQLDKSQRETSLARARAGAMGTNINRGSVADYLSVLESENMKSYDWMKQAHANQIAAQKMEGSSQVKALQNQAKSYGRQATGALISGVGETFETGMKAGGWYGSDAWYMGGK